MEKIPENKHIPILEKMKDVMKVLGVAVPLSVNQADALGGQVFNTQKTSESAATSEQKVHESFGERKNFSLEEWKLLEQYRFRSLWAETEFVGHYGILPDGRIVAPTGSEKIAGEHGGIVHEENQIEQLQKIKEARIAVIHQHPVQTAYNGLYQDMAGQFNETAMSPENWKKVLEENKKTIESIRLGKLLSAWPPSIRDIVTMVCSYHFENRVVDANGIWTVRIDPSIPKGKELLQKSVEENIMNDQVMAHPSEENTKKYNEAMMRIWQSLPQDYQQRQIAVAKPTANQEEWKKAINDFIAYAEEGGLKISYTLFDEVGK